MKILVTGAGGFLGRGIVKKLLDNGVDVIATDVQNNNIDQRAEIKIGDIFSLQKPYEYFGKPDVLLHLAWRNGFVHNAETHIEDLPKHDAFVKKMIDEGVKKCVVMGTMHEIGFIEGSIDENTPCKPMTLYGIAKNALRQSLELYTENKKVDFMWLRGYYIVSNDANGASIFSKIVQAVNNGQIEFPFTMGINQYDYLDYEDFCKMTVASVLQNEVLGIINICSGRPEKLSDRVERFIKENNYDINLKYGFFPDRPYDSKAVWGNDNKIRKIMNCIDIE